MIQVKSNIAKMVSYSPPWSNIDRTKYLRLDLNENTQNPPEHVIEALKKNIDEKRIQLYPAYGNFLKKLAQYTKTDVDRLIITNGSDQAIDIVLRAFLDTRNNMVIAQPGFPIFNQVAGVIGSELIGVPYDNELHFQFDDFINAINQHTALIVIINPDNPTGSAVSLETIKTILDMNPEVPVFVDEAYFEYTGVTAQIFLKSFSNLIITRTFSKAFAMAGLRLGYIIAHPDIIFQLYKIRGPFDINSCALVAAEAQIDYPDQWKNYVHEIMNNSKPFLEQFFMENNVIFYSGAAHFMLVRPKNRDQAVQYLKNHGILVRPMTAPLIKDTFRMNVGMLDQTKKFSEVYAQYLQEVEQKTA